MDTPTPTTVTTNSETGSNKRHNRASSSTSPYNILKGLSSLQTVAPSRQASIKNHLLASESFVKRLEQQPQLKGHRGCVNTIAWDETGEFLVSGSDDRKLNVYKPLDAQPLVHSIPSGHTQNIFSAKFLTGSSAQTIISCSADGITRLTSVPRFVATSRTGDWSPSPGFNCHTSMTYEVMSDLVDGHIFYDCADDGRFNRYDTRIRTSCDCDEEEACERHTFININSHLYRPPLRDMSMEDRLFHTFRRRRNEIGISAIAQQPENPVYFAAACSDDTVRIYDSRKVDPSNHRGAQVYSFSAYVPVQYVVGPNGELERGVNHDRSSLETRITSLKYDPCGTGQLLVSYSRGNCYLVDPSRLETKSDEAARISASDRRRSSSQSHESPKGKRRRSVSDEPAKKSSPDGASSLMKSETVAVNEVATTRVHDDSGTEDLTPPVSQDVKGKATLRSGSNHSKDKGESVSAQKQKTRAKFELSTRSGYFGNVMDVKGKGGDEDDDKDNDNDGDGGEDREDEDEDEEMSFEDTDDEGDIISQKYKEARRTLPQEQLADDRDYWRQRTYLTAKSDLAQTYWGHANVKTMIKEANFYGPNSEFVMSGSDDGRIYVWNKKTGKLVNVVRGDKRVVNCLHPHPFSKFLLAASGIDNTIKIFMPTAEERVNMSKVRGIKRRIVEPFEVKPDSATGQEGWPKGPPEDELDPEYAFERVFHIPVGLGSSTDPSDDSEIHTSTDDDDGVDDDDDEDGSDIAGDFLSHLPPHMVFQILRQVIHQEGRVHDLSGNEDEEDDE